jgi:hypothetical protein
MIACEWYFNKTDAQELWIVSIETSPAPMIYLLFQLQLETHSPEQTLPYKCINLCNWSRIANNARKIILF